jgi:hypothetical protein
VEIVSNSRPKSQQETKPAYFDETHAKPFNPTGLPEMLHSGSIPKNLLNDKHLQATGVTSAQNYPQAAPPPSDNG